MSHSYPFVTVIMPIRNESDFITRSLGAVLSQDYPHDCLEILIADGMSTDNTRHIINNLKTTTTITLKIIDNVGLTVPAGFNAALEQARGEIIVRVDGHTVIGLDYVRQCVELLKNADVDNVGGKMTAEGVTDLGKAIAVATSVPFGVGGARFHYANTEEYVDTVYMGAWRRELFDRIGKFDEELVRNQDDEFNYRLRAAGGIILLSPRVKSIYFNRSSLSTLWNQYYQYGLYKVRVMQKHPRQMRPRQFVPFFLVGTCFGGGIFSIWNRHLRILWSATIGLYIVFNLLASILTAYQHGWRHLKYLPTVFAILHVSYGLGFWRGLLKFRKSWK